MPKLKEGKAAPKFALKDRAGEIHQLNELSSKYVVVYFYPKDSTPGCTIEAIDFSALRKRFEKAGATVIGISGGDEKSKTKFCKDNGLKILLLSDSDFKVSKAFGVYGPKKFMGRTFNGISRTTFVLDKYHKVLKIFPKVKAEGHAAQVLEFISLI